MRGAKFRRGFAILRLAVNVIDLLLKLVFVIVVFSSFHLFFQLTDALLFFFRQDSFRHGKTVQFTVLTAGAQFRHAELSPAPALLLLNASGEHGKLASQQGSHQRRIGKGTVPVAEQIGGQRTASGGIGFLAHILKHRVADGHLVVSHHFAKCMGHWHTAVPLCLRFFPDL
ncbi:Uncharacterised protein [Enterobacter hormaechei]|nr:Uncharacterised protein [Enterobacter hormaechei]SAG24038.1 Uncharacterised protein [Enterobacter hormaechei]SAH94882.1 Uncharacterised protein [Enterobacter hormaechei]